MSLVRVLHVISGIDPANGGPTQALHGLAAAQVTAGLDVSIVATWQQRAGLENADTFRAAGADVTMVGPARGGLNRHEHLEPTIKTAVEAADVVHVHALWQWPQHLAAEHARRTRTSYVIRPCGGLHPWSLAQGRWKKRLAMLAFQRHDLDAAAAIHYTTETERDAAAPLALRAPATVEPNGTELADRPVPDRDEARRRLVERVVGLGEGPIALFLGRIQRKKGLDLLVPAFVDYAERGGEGSLVIAGNPEDADLTAALRRQSERIAGRVHFVGQLDRAATVDTLAAADLLCLTSYTENFGIVVIEALAVATPVLASDQVEAAALFDEEVGPIVPLDVGAITDALAAWMPDRERREAAGRRGRATVQERFGWNPIARRWAERYESLVEGRR